MAAIADTLTAFVFG